MMKKLLFISILMLSLLVCAVSAADLSQAVSLKGGAIDTAKTSIDLTNGKMSYTDKASGISMATDTVINGESIKAIDISSGNGDKVFASDDKNTATFSYRYFDNGTIKETIVLKQDQDLSFPIDVPEGFVLIPWYSGQYKIVEASMEDTMTGLVAQKPYGVDALGRYVDMNYILRDNVLTLSYNKTLVTYNGNITSYVSITYPLTIDPTWTSTGGCWTAVNGIYTVLKWNTTGNTSWTPPAGISSFDYLIVGGGGVGGYSSNAAAEGGGGGAGGVVSGSTMAAAPTFYVLVGAGGGTSFPYNGSISAIVSTSLMNSLIAGGGGSGGYGASMAGTNGYSASGGGARYSGVPGVANNSYGHNGGYGTINSAFGTGGGGGAGGIGGNGSSSSAGVGGAGISNDIDGTGTYYGGGGAGALLGGASQAGGTGGGGQTGKAGTNGLGGGGGGSNSTIGTWGGVGGSGVVLIRYLTPVVAPVADFTGSPTTLIVGNSVVFSDASVNATSWQWTFGDGNTSTTQNPTFQYNVAGTYTVALTVSNSGGSDTKTRAGYITVNTNPSIGITKTTTSFGTQTVVKFNGTGVSNWTAPTGVTSVWYMVVAGGGGGGSRHGGGGGAGGLLNGTTTNITAGNMYNITVGAGGLGDQSSSSSAHNGSIGGSSTFSNITTTGGGGGGGGDSGAGQAGGSGGGGVDRFGASGGANVSGQGWAGATTTGNFNAGGGGGGAGEAGHFQSGATLSGIGGNGSRINITGILTYYAGGGGAGNNNSAGGLGGGGMGGYGGAATAGTDDFGGGGGGMDEGAYAPAGNGGNGVVYIRYTTPTLFNPTSYMSITPSPSIIGIALNGTVQLNVRNITAKFIYANIGFNKSEVNIQRVTNNFSSYPGLVVNSVYDNVTGLVSINISNNTGNNITIGNTITPVADLNFYAVSNMNGSAPLNFALSNVVLSTGDTENVNATVNGLITTSDSYFTFNVRLINSATNTLVTTLATISTSGANITPTYIQTSSGTATFSSNYSNAVFNVTCSGYYDLVQTVLISSNNTIDLRLTPLSGPSQSTWYSPHQVRINVVDKLYGTRLIKVHVDVTPITSTFPQDGTSDWLVNMYGINPASANDMLNGTLVMSGTTGDDGGVVFTMLSSIGYSVHIYDGINIDMEAQVYPIESDYNILVTGAVFDNTMSDINGTQLTYNAPNASYGKFGLIYSDTSGQTSNVNFTVWNIDNGTMMYAIDLTGFGTNTVYANYTVKAISGQQYIWKYDATRGV